MLAMSMMDNDLRLQLSFGESGFLRKVFWNQGVRCYFAGSLAVERWASTDENPAQAELGWGTLVSGLGCAGAGPHGRAVPKTFFWNRLLRSAFF